MAKTKHRRPKHPYSSENRRRKLLQSPPLQVRKVYPNIKFLLLVLNRLKVPADLNLDIVHSLITTKDVIDYNLFWVLKMYNIKIEWSFEALRAIMDHQNPPDTLGVLDWKTPRIQRCIEGFYSEVFFTFMKYDICYLKWVLNNDVLPYTFDGDFLVKVNSVEVFKLLENSNSYYFNRGDIFYIRSLEVLKYVIVKYNITNVGAYRTYSLLRTKKMCTATEYLFNAGLITYKTITYLFCDWNQLNSLKSLREFIRLGIVVFDGTNLVLPHHANQVLQLSESLRGWLAKFTRVSGL